MPTGRYLPECCPVFRPCERYFSRAYLCCRPPGFRQKADGNARQIYSVVKDLDCLNNRLNARFNESLSDCLVGLGGIEPPTSPLSGVRSSHLSYGPKGVLLSPWWSWSGSNRRPPECKSGALPAELQPLENQSRPVGCRDHRDQPYDR